MYNWSLNVYTYYNNNYYEGGFKITTRYTSKMLPLEKVLRDPIHDYIYIKHQVILDLINTREFQRLRRIKQLGTTNYTFHSAEHSRFTHSVGVY